MYTSSHEQDAFQQLVTQRQQNDDAALNADPTVKAARDKLVDRQRELDNLQSYISSLPARDRFQYLGNVDAALQAIEQAKQAELKAHNDFWRDRHAAARAQANAERDAALEAERQQVAQQREQAEKRDFKLAWVTANGSTDGFEQAWKTHHDAERLKRTEAAQQELRRTLHRQVGHIKF